MYLEILEVELRDLNIHIANYNYFIQNLRNETVLKNINYIELTVLQLEKMNSYKELLIKRISGFDTTISFKDDDEGLREKIEEIKKQIKEEEKKVKINNMKEELKELNGKICENKVLLNPQVIGFDLCLLEIQVRGMESYKEMLEKRIEIMVEGFK